MREQTRGHLGPPRVVYAHEQDFGDFFHDATLTFCQCTQAVLREPADEEWEIGVEARCTRELFVRLEDEALDGFVREGAVELLGELGDEAVDSSRCHLFVGHGVSASSGSTRSAVWSVGCQNRATPTAQSAPATCMTMNIGALAGRMPANVSVSVRATVTAGFAKLVDDVNQYAAAM